MPATEVSHRGCFMGTKEIFAQKIVRLISEIKGNHSKSVIIESMADVLVKELKIARDQALMIVVKAYQLA